MSFQPQVPGISFRTLLQNLLFFVALLLLTGCPKEQQNPSKRDLPAKSSLRFRLNRFNQLLRWNHFQGAKVYVLPKVRSRYIIMWEQERDLRKIAGFSIRDITYSKEGDKAFVLIMTQEYRSNVMSVRKVFKRQTWTAHKGDWFFFGEKKSKALTLKKTKP